MAKASSLLAQFRWDGMSGLPVAGPWRDRRSRHPGPYLQPSGGNHVAAAQLAVDGEIEHGRALGALLREAWSGSTRRPWFFAGASSRSASLYSSGVWRAFSDLPNRRSCMLISSVCRGRQHASSAAGGHFRFGLGAFRPLPSMSSAPGSRNLTPSRHGPSASPLATGHDSWHPCNYC
jgi:hypothetical protein